MIYYTHTYHIFLLQGAYKLQTTTYTYTYSYIHIPINTSYFTCCNIILNLNFYKHFKLNSLLPTNALFIKHIVIIVFLKC